MGEPEWFPRFHHWPLTGTDGAQSAFYSFVDGATLDGLGIISLLRRGYPVILAFVNTQEALGGTSPYFATEEVTAGLARLFGLTRPIDALNDQSIQVFPTEQFFPLRDALLPAKADGKAAYFMDRYTILQPNPFDIPRIRVTTK